MEDIIQQLRNDHQEFDKGSLEGYFGDHPDIVEFARELLLAGKRDGAKELNQMLKVVGHSVSADEIIKRLQSQYFPYKATQSRFTQKPKTEWEKIQDQVSKDFEDSNSKSKKLGLEILSTLNRNKPLP
jgi:hypothetical protein